MKVLILSHMYPSSVDPVFGIFVHKQAQELVKQGCEVRVVAPVPLTPPLLRKLKGKWQRYSQIPREEDFEGIKVYHPRYLSLPRNILLAYSGYLYYSSAKGDIRRIYDSFPFDVIHAHVAVPDGQAATIAGRAYGKPTVVTFHGHNVYNIPELNHAYRRAVTSVARGVSRVVVVSTALGNELREYVSDRDFFVVSNGYSPGDVSPGSSELASRYGGKRVILSVGYLIPRKAHKYVVMAMAKLLKAHPNIVYVIIGKGDEERPLQGLVKEMGLQDAVEFIGQVPHRDVMAYLATCDIFALPSWDESFGVVYVEAMAHGRPVVACRGEGIQDVIADGETGALVEPKDVDSLTNTLGRLLEDQAYARRLGEAGRTLVARSLTWQQSAEKLRQLYEELMHGGANGPRA